jgi:tetratricopeptide (TPR) repeat protein
MNVQAWQRCDDAQIRQILDIAAQDAAAGVRAIDALLAQWPGDARLHFLKGSLLIGLRRHIMAHAALTRAIEIDPDYVLARFQLGFFELTSGEAEAALATLAPLMDLPQGHYLRHFAQGLDDLVYDRFDSCIVNLRAGQAANGENEPLNRDMELIVQKCAGLERSTAPETAADEISATSLLLRSTGLGGRLH